MLGQVARRRIGAFACTVCFPATAHAAPSARLVYVRDVGAENCPDEFAVRSAVAARLGYDPFVVDARATLHAEIAKAGRKYRVRVKLVDDHNVIRGGRELTHEGERCSDLVDAMALSMSIAIDPFSLAGPRPVDSSDPPSLAGADPLEIEPSAPVAPSIEPQSSSAPPRPERPSARRTVDDETVTFVVGAAVAGWVGAASSPSASGAAFVGLRSSNLGVFVEARGDLPASRRAAGGTISSSFVGGSLVPCVHWSLFFGCAIVTAGRFRAESGAIAQPRDDAAFHLLTGPRAGIEVPLSSSWSARLAGDLLYSLTSQTLRIDGREVFVLPRISGGVMIGPTVRFP